MWPALDQFFARDAVITPPGFGCARLATLAFAPPHPGGVMTEGRKTIYRKSFTPASSSSALQRSNRIQGGVDSSTIHRLLIEDTWG